jgi:hypothetical protein
MAKLTLLNTCCGLALRRDGCDGSLVLAKESNDDPCCCCPDIPQTCCVRIQKSNGEGSKEAPATISGTFYVMRCSPSLPSGSPACADGPTSCAGDHTKAAVNGNCKTGFPQCIVDAYKVYGKVKAGSGFDDFGEVEGITFDNHIPCGPGLASKTTTTTTDSEEFELTFEALEPNPCEEGGSAMYCIPIKWSATSSNCGPPQGINAQVCIRFESKDSSNDPIPI